MKGTVLITHWLQINLRIWDGRSVGNMSRNVCVQSFLALRCILRKPWGIFRELIPRTTTTRVAFWDPPSGSKKWWSISYGKITVEALFGMLLCRFLFIRYTVNTAYTLKVEQKKEKKNKKTNVPSTRIGLSCSTNELGKNIIKVCHMCRMDSRLVL